MNECVMKKNEPIYEEIRSLSPFFLIISGIYMAVLTVIFFAAGYDYTLLVGGIYGIIIAALNFLILGKTAQAAVKKASAKSAQTYMSGMYCVRYLALISLLSLGAIAPFISLITAIIPLFFPKFAILIRTFIRKEE
ncbi:MAG: hypothetical protein J6C38_07260 [Oscillospiraceae bacterium]|nr:hypothetical protein [Oscillospiraceae bacterium]